MQRDALVLGHAPDAPAQAREHHLRDQPAARRRRPEGRGHRRRRRRRRALSRPFRPHGRRAAGQSKSGFRDFLADGVWRRCAWPDGEETEALIVAPLDSPRLTRLLGRFVEFGAPLQGGRRAGRRTRRSASSPRRAARRRRPATARWSTWRCTRSSPSAACSAARADLFSLRGERPQPLFALIADGQPEELALAVGSLSLAAARGGARRAADPDRAGRAGRQRRRALDSLPFACVRYTWRGARAVFDGLDDALGMRGTPWRWD